MFENLKLNTLLMLSFGSILMLVFVISLVAYSGLKNGHDSFVDYRGLARDTNLAGRVQANMLSMRLSVLKFINTRSQAAIDEFELRSKKMKKFLQEAKSEIQEPSRARLVKDVDSEVDDYINAFEKVVSLYEKRNALVSDQLDPSGLEMRKVVSNIIVSSNDDNNAQASFYASQLQEHLLLARLYVTKYLVTNAQEDAERAQSELTDEMPKFFQQLEANLYSYDRLELIKSARSHHQNYLKTFGEIRSVIQERNDYIDNTLNRIGPLVASKIEEVKLSVKTDQDTLGPKVQHESENFIVLINSISVLVIIIGVTVSWRMAIIVRRPIGGEPREIAEITSRISEGDLSKQLTVNEKDTGIYRSVCDMSSKLRSLISSIIDTSDKLIHSANESSNIISSNVETVENQKSMTESVVVAVEQMSQSILEVVNLASNSEDKSRVGMDETTKGRETVKVAVKSINELSENLNSSMNVIKNLEKQSSEIDSVIEVIQGISEQTNLLALNAAIEAARAGEQGRGFAVVADEVRTLAQRTQESTTEIQEIIQNLQNGTSQTVTVMEQSVSKARDTVEFSNKTDQALSTIYDMINDISQMNTQVATAVAEQSNVVKEVTANMANINDTFDDTLSKAQSAQAMSSDVRQMAATLNELADGFKV
ncbi:HAMP domain-containing methyl-accepting chemotaxis protein [Agarilytica rhodophyticola]|uniref:HAMP domain-containing methyl-accepting chemotaxis protein n=1 Tax=Agarilytica rhodophyticola TaxID=1737490 RepID=UPI000B3473DB|nr:methyl-accepting chemotaxis protein [Agarilytica rhodophyticola]